MRLSIWFVVAGNSSFFMTRKAWFHLFVSNILLDKDILVGTPDMDFNPKGLFLPASSNTFA